ncbi:MAG TPA: amino acid adenylation domain-containing protein, partial [Thermoanaerobaculia bacterium]|nr:amino acid adenylation domain-containing protein [Thermoanaerobaculia bacterium]
LDRARTFEDLLGQARDVALSAYTHQDLPFERLVDELSPERSLGHTPLFQVMLVLQNVERSGLHAAGLKLSPFGGEPGVAKFDLLLSLTEEDGAIRGELDFRTGLFDRTTAVRLAGHLVSLLASAVSAPETLWADLAFLSPAERHQMVAEWNDTDASGAGEATLHGLVEAQTQRTPEAVAVTFGEESLSYAELGRRAGWLAWRLRGLGVGPEVRVGICAERSLELVIGLLGILKAGGAYVPLDPDHPDARLALVIEDARPPVVLAQESLERRAQGLLDAGGLGLAAASAGEGPAPRLRGGAGADHAAYVMFTSGSTGRPKGVVNTHRGIVNRLLWMQSAYGLTAADRVLQKTPFGFDVSVWELFWPLWTGARLVVAAPGGHQDSAYLVRTIAESGITHVHFVPSLLRAFLEEPEVEAVCGLRRVIASGEALPPDLAQRFHERLGARGVELHNLYGPTEAAVDVTFHACRPGEERVPIGRPVARTRILLLDRDGGPVPAGVAGELHIGGAQVARGYLGRPDLTAERFVPDPWGEAGARLYRTGDLARHLPDGEVEYLGRIDHQVKVRGVRIELGEVEAALLAEPGIREAVVVVREDRPGDRRLVAYAAGDAVEISILRERLGRRLPAALVPAAFVVLGSLPKNPNGKIDRRALPAPEETGPAKPGAAPRDPFEEVIAGLWAELLGRPRVGVDESFFELGGHSLLAMRLASRLREVFGVELRVRALFEGPTVAELARRVREAIHAGAGSELPPIRPVPRDGELPLSFAQQRLWFLWHFEPESPAYNMTGALRIRGPLDVAAAGRTLSEIVRRHEVLRTTFPAEAGRPGQRIGPASELALAVEDLSALPAPEERAREAFRAEARRPFDLSRETPLRARLLRLGPGDHVLLLNLHHIASDAWSMGLLEREVTALYEAFAAGRPSPLPELPVQYA